MVLIILGDGVVASTLLDKSKGTGGGWFAITAGWGFAVMAGIFTAMACGSTDAHINPAVTVGLAIINGDFSKVLTYIPAQIAGAFVGAVLVWLAYWGHWRGTTDAVAKRGVFCTIPAIRSYGANLVTEAVGTALLVIVGVAFGAKAISATGLPPGYAPLLWAFLVWSIGLSLGGPTGYAINPARDLGPRLAHAVLPIPGKGPSDWSYAPIPILGPLIGCAVGAAIVKVFHY
jgi:glycerol uptake facilitator protein